MDRVRVFMFWPGPSADNYYRIWLPANYCGRELYGHGVEVVWGPEFPLGEPFDCYWVHGIIDALDIAHLEARHDAGCRIVWDLDDDYWEFPQDEVPQWEWIEPRLPAQAALLDLADLIVVSTEPLAKVLEVPDKTIVCPNLVEPFDTRLPPRIPGPTRFLVAGSYVHDKTVVAVLTDPILRLSRELRGQAEFIFLGACPPRLKPFVTHIEAVPFDDYWPTLRDIAPDVWLMPMVSSPYMDCKTPLKWIESARAGAALIVSDVPTYRTETKCNRVLVAGVKDWEAEIRDLYRDPMRQRILCENARQELMTNHSWTSPARGVWLEAFRRALS